MYTITRDDVRQLRRNLLAVKAEAEAALHELRLLDKKKIMQQPRVGAAAMIHDTAQAEVICAMVANAIAVARGMVQPEFTAGENGRKERTA